MPRKPLPEAERAARRIASKRKYDAANRDKKAAYRAANRDTIAARDKAYREANKEQIEARAKPQRDLKKDAKREYDKLYREANADRIRSQRATRREHTQEYMAQWRRANRDRLRRYNERYAEENRDRINAYRAVYNKDNPNRGCPRKKQARVMYRRATKKQAVPVWFSELDELIMLEAATLCRQREAATGFKWHVDHIVPLVSEQVCGLHIGCNIQVIPAAENQSKGNRYWPDMP